MKIAILQMIPTENELENKNKAVIFCKKAKEKGADLAVFPELFNVNYESLLSEYNLDKSPNKANSLKSMQEKSITLDSDFVKTFVSLSKQLNMAIAVTFLEKTKKMPKNSVIIIDRHGKIVLHYSKVHTVDNRMEILMTPGSDFYVCNLDIGNDIVKVGSAICFDRDYPESFISLMLKGAEIVIIPNACDMRKIILDELKVRAYENVFGVVCVNPPIYGKDICSSAFSPIVSYSTGSDATNNKKNYELDSTLLVMKEEEKVGIVEFDVEAIREYRKTVNRADSYRKPWAYKILTSKKQLPVFKRLNSRRKKP